MLYICVMIVWLVVAAEECESMACSSHGAAYDGDVGQLERLLQVGLLSLDHRDQSGSTMLHKGS